METLAEYAHEAPGLWFGGARLYAQAEKLAARTGAPLDAVVVTQAED